MVALSILHVSTLIYSIYHCSIIVVNTEILPFLLYIILFIHVVLSFRRHQVSFFNPHVTCWSEALIPYESRAKEKCHILLYVITGHSTSVGSLVEVFRHVCSVCCVHYILCY